MGRGQPLVIHGYGGEIGSEFLPDRQSTPILHLRRRPLAEVHELVPQVVVAPGQFLAVRGLGGEIGSEFLPDRQGRLVFRPRFVVATEFQPEVADAMVPLAANRPAAFVVALAVGERLPSFQSAFQVRLFFRAEVRLRPDQLFDGIVGAGPVVGQGVGLGLLGFRTLGCFGGAGLFFGDRLGPCEVSLTVGLGFLTHGFE